MKIGFDRFNFEEENYAFILKTEKSIKNFFANHKEDFKEKNPSWFKRYSLKYLLEAKEICVYVADGYIGWDRLRDMNVESDTKIIEYKK